MGVGVREEGETDEVGGRGFVLTGYCMHAKVQRSNTQVERSLVKSGMIDSFRMTARVP